MSPRNPIRAATDLDKGVGHFLLTTINNCRQRSKAMGKSPQSIAGMSGNWLEYGVLIALKERQLLPAYWQAQFAAVPDNYDDMVIFSQEYGPVVLSCKTSLRERYKTGRPGSTGAAGALSAGPSVSRHARC